MKTFAAQMIALTFMASTSFAGALSPDHPDVLICDVAKSGDLPAAQSFLFLSAVGEDGSVLYQSFGNSTLSALFDPDGNLQGPSANICGGMSLGELEAAGKTRSF